MTDRDSQLGIDVCSLPTTKTNANVFRTKLSFYAFGSAEYVTNPDESIKSLAIAGTPRIGANYLKTTFTALDKTLRSYYSTNGTTWTLLASFIYKDSYKPMNALCIWKNHLNATIPVDSIKFIYDGEVLFGKE